jgi:hypothetical protein
MMVISTTIVDARFGRRFCPEAVFLPNYDAQIRFLSRRGFSGEVCFYPDVVFAEWVSPEVVFPTVLRILSYEVFPASRIV